MKRIRLESLEAVHTHTDSLEKQRGITLIALVVTIVVLLILAGVSLNLVLGDNGIVKKAQEAKVSQELSGYKEKLQMFIVEKKAESDQFDENTLTAYKNKLYYNTKTENAESSIEYVLGNISNRYIEKLEIINGDICINTTNSIEQKVAKTVGMKVNYWDINDGELISSDKNLGLLNNGDTVVIPPSVKKIGAGAFASVENLRKVVIPGTVEEIGDNAFANDTILEEVIMEEGVKKVGKFAFFNCIKIKKIDFPDSVIEIGENCMDTCTSLVSVRLSNNIVKIKDSAFIRCTALPEIVVPKNVEEIGGYVFSSNKLLSKIQFPAKLSKIGSGTFSGTYSLNDIVIDEKNENLKFENGLLMSRDGTKVYYGLLKLESVVIPDGVENVAGDCFNGSNITVISFPNSINLTGYEFAGMNKLKTINISSDNPNYKTEDGNLYSKDGKKLFQYLKSEDEIIKIPEGVTTLMPYSIRNKNVKNIILPETLESIRVTAFSNISGIEVINIPKNVKPFDARALPSNFKINVSNENGYIKSVDDTMVLSKDGKILYATSRGIETFSIPNTVESIESYSFYYNHNIKSINIPNGVKEIKKLAFAYNTLQQVTISDTVESIADDAFLNCSQIKNIIINKKRGSISGSPWACPLGERAITWKIQ